jgi:acyl carrier protein
MIEVVKEMLNEELGVEGDIKLDSKLREDLNIDSLLAVQLSVLLENKYNIEITEEELVNLVTIKDVVDLLESKGVKA